VADGKRGRQVAGERTKVSDGAKIPLAAPQNKPQTKNIANLDSNERKQLNRDLKPARALSKAESEQCDLSPAQINQS